MNLLFTAEVLSKHRQQQKMWIFVENVYITHKIIVSDQPNGPLCPLGLQLPTQLQKWMT